MFWKVRSRSFIRLIGGFILSKSGVIYTHADIDVYIFNSNISSYCIIIKTMGAALQSEKSSRRTAGAECRGTRVRLAPSAGGCWAAAPPRPGPSVRGLTQKGRGHALCVWPALHRNTWLVSHKPLHTCFQLQNISSDCILQLKQLCTQCVTHMTNLFG